jgi:predicted nicotinamide N-methyase
MKCLKINYKTKIEQKKIGHKLFVLEVIKDLDEAIDLICEAMDENEKLDPFAEDLCPYFGVLWPAGEALAEFLYDNPQLVNRKKILEIGSGVGLPSMVASFHGGEVLATDFHPDVETFFLRNCRHSVVTCSYERMNWREENKYNQAFDVVIGSDILYESKHPEEVAKALRRFLKPHGKIILSDPGRSYLNMFLHACDHIGLKHEKHIKEISGKSVLVYVLSEVVETDGHTHNG